MRIKWNIVWAKYFTNLLQKMGTREPSTTVLCLQHSSLWVIRANLLFSLYCLAQHNHCLSSTSNRNPLSNPLPPCHYEPYTHKAELTRSLWIPPAPKTFPQHGAENCNPSSLNSAWQCRTLCLPGDIQRSRTPRAPRCPDWTRQTPRQSSIIQQKFKAHCTEARQRHLTLLPFRASAQFFPDFLPLLFSYTWIFSAVANTWQWINWSTGVFLLALWPTIRTKKWENNEMLEWIINTKLFVLL